MTMTWRKTKVLLSAILVVLHVLFLPVSMIYAETVEAPIHETEEDLEPLELPSIKNYLEEGETSEPRFFFTQSRMQGMIEEPIKVTFFSDQEVSEARVTLPNEAKLLKEQLPAGLTAKQGTHSHEWIIQTERVRNTFVLPVVFDSVGNYEVAVEDATATIEVQEPEETSEEVPVEETESSDEDSAGQEDLKEEENGIEEEQENEQPAEDVREPVVEAPQEQQTDEEETDEPTVFDGETAEVTTMAQFREAVANPDIGIISVQANLTEATANVLTVDRPLLIQGNGYTLTFGINGFYFQLAEVVEPSAFRIENTRLTKVGTTPLINATVESSKNWTVELENITEVNANTMRLASLPEGNIHFTGGVSNFTRTASAQTFIVAKEVVATNQAEVTISRGNAAVFFSSATVANPKFTVEQGATVTITTTAGVANPIDFRGENSEIALRGNGQLTVNTIGPATTAVPTDTSNNAIALTGLSPKISISEKSRLSVRSTLSKRGIHLAGANAQVHVANSELTVVSATQTAMNISGEAPLFSAENSTVQLTSTTGQRINLIGSEPTLTMKNSQLNMNASTGTGINLQGATPQVLMDNSQLLMTDTGASWGILLTGTDALFSLSNQSEVHLTGAGTGTTENIRIGANHARPELSVTGGSTLSVTTTSGTTAATDTANNAINIRGINAQLNVIDSTLNVNIRSGNRRALLVRGDSSVGEIYDSKINLDTLNSGGMEFIGDMPNVKISGSKTEVIINSAISENAFKGNIYIGGVSNVSPGRNAELEIVENATVELNGGNFATLMINSTDAKVNIYSEASLAVNGRNNDGVNAPIRFRAGNGYQFNIDGGHFFAGKNGGNSPVIRMSGSNNKISVLNGGVFEVDNPGNGVANDGGVAGGNQGVFYPSATDIGPNTFEVKGQGSYIVIDAKSGPGIDLEGSARGQVIGSNGGYLSVSGRTATAAGGIFNANILHVVFDNPLFMDYRNNRSGGGRIFNVSNGSTLSGINSDLSLWRSGTDLNNDPTFTFDALDFEFTGSNYQNLYSTSKPEELNTSVIGTNGLSQFSRLSSNNARWVIADELHLPTDADKHIYGRISVPVGLHDSRPSWTNEVKVTVELDRVDGTKRNFSGYTVGHSDDSPGISIYGEEARGGLFEIELDDYLVEGDKVRIVELEQTNSNSDDFENINLTKTLTTVPVMPPKPASFSGSIIPNHIREIVGYSENPQVTIEANYNGNALDTTDVEVDQDGYFSIFVGDLELKEDDEIQVFLRDKKGSAESAGILKPPTTNNEQGNINPKELYEYHDAIFQPATILKVVSDISPLDPLDPEIEVEPENKPELPEEQGLLSIDFVSSFNFGSQPITVNDQTYYAQPQRLLNADGAVNETEERPNYVQISDRRPENDRNGWQLAVTQNDQFTATNNRELNGARLRLTNQQLATAQGGSAPEFQQTNPLALIPGNRRILLMAQGTEGAGTWIYRFGNQETASESVALDVPKGANPEATRYETTLTWELSAVPDN